MKSILTIFILLSLVVSGLAQTRNVVVGTSGAVVSPTNFWSADVTNARAGLGLGSAATNPATAFQPSSSVLTNLAANNGSSLTNIPVAGVVGALSTNGNGAGLTNLTAANITGTVGLASNVTGTIAISNGGSGATTAGGARTNLGLGATWLTNTTASNFRTAIGLGQTNDVRFSRIDGTVITSSGGIEFEDNAGGITRTNLGLGLAALTNTNTAGFNTSLYGSGTNPVLYNTNGEVVSPTNFWQVAPIVTRFVEFDPPTNASTNIVAARNLHIHSLAISRTGVTSTIALPTNNSFNGDIALVVHQGPTSSVTAIRQAGAGTNLITLNQPEEAVEFVYYNNVWQFNHNLSYTEPIFFSGTNAAANAAASRTNLGLGLPALTNTDVTNFRTAIGLGATNNVAFSNIVSSGTLTSTGVVTALSNAVVGGTLTATGVVTTVTNLNVGGSINVTNAAATRTNLGIPLAALTNTTTAGFQRAILQTNSTPAAGANLGDAKAWLEISVVTNNVTNSFRIPVFQ